MRKSVVSSPVKVSPVERRIIAAEVALEERLPTAAAVFLFAAKAAPGKRKPTDRERIAALIARLDFR